MTNIQYLKENNLYEAHQQFKRLTEGYLVPMEEDAFYEDDDPNANGDDPNAMGDDPNAMGGDPNMGADPNAMGADPNAMGGDGPNAMGGDPNMGADPNNMGADPNMMGGDPNMDADPNMMDMGDEEDADDGTIDIDGLTKAQEKLDVKQNHVGRDLAKVDSKLKSVMDAVEKLEQMIDAHNREIADFKSEFEKRNPTQTEKLNLRFMDSYPFNVRANEYFKNLPKDSNYSAYGDNEEPTSKEYKITNNDVDDYESNIMDTFFNIDDDDIQTIDKIFG